MTAPPPPPEVSVRIVRPHRARVILILGGLGFAFARLLIERESLVALSRPLLRLDLGCTFTISRRSGASPKFISRRISS